MAVKARQQYYADETSLKKEAREFGMLDALKDKLDSVEYGAQVNVIEEVQENGVPLEIVDKSVNVLVPEVIDNLYTLDPDNSLSAKQGKILYDMIKNLLARGRFLSTWNTATGLPMTNPTELPYEYKAGDYYIVSTVAAEGGTNFRPEPDEYDGTASNTQETQEVRITDIYVYDGENWLLLINSTREIAVDDYVDYTFESTNPVENQAIAKEFVKKQNKFYTVSTTSPSNPNEGDEWYDSTNDKVFYWDGTQWKEMGGGGQTYTAGLHISIDANDNNKINVVEWSATVSDLGLVCLGSDIRQTNIPNNVTSTANRTYCIQTNNTGNMVVNVPWTDTTYTQGEGITIDTSNNNRISCTVKPVQVGPAYQGTPSTGCLWYDTTKNTMFLYKNNAWTIIGPEIYPITKADYDALTPAEQGDGRFFLITDNDGTIYVDWENVQNRVVYTGSTAPANPGNGYIWLDTSDFTLYGYNSTLNDWEPIGGGGGGTYTAGDGIDIDANNEISVDVTDIIGTGLSEDASNNIIVDTTVVATQTDLSGKQDKATSGSGAPSTTPTYVGQVYIDTTNDNMYVATGTSSSSDWTAVDTNTTYTAGDGIDIDANNEISVDVTDIIGTGLTEDASNNIIVDTTVVATQTDLSGKQDKATSGSGAPATTPTYVGQQYVDTTNDILYVATGTSSSSDWTAVDTNTTYTAGDGIDIDANNEISVDASDLAGTGLSTDNGNNLIVDTTVIQEKLTAGDGIDIDANNEISVDVTDIIGTGLSEDSSNNLIVDSTVVALKSDLANYYTKTETYTKTEVDNLIASVGSFEVVATLPSVSTADTKKIYLLGPIGTGADKYEEWIVTETTTGDYVTDDDATIYKNTGPAFKNDVTAGGQTYHLLDYPMPEQIQIEIPSKKAWASPGVYFAIKGFSPSTYHMAGSDNVDINISNGNATFNQTRVPYDSGQYSNSISFLLDGDDTVDGGNLYVSVKSFHWDPTAGTTEKVWTKIGETSVDLSGYATTTALTNGLATKQDTLTAGDGIDIDANNEISVDVTDIIGTGLSEDANNNIIVDTTVVATQTDLSGKQDKATSGSTAPSTTPSYVGQQYIDTTANKMYVATGTSSSSDWTEVGSGGGGGTYTGGNGINIDANNEITIDTTVVATQTDLSGKAAASDLNTKAFYISDTTDTTNAQAALDWYNAGKTPILVMSNRTYHLWHRNSGNDGILFFQCTETSIGANNELQYIAPYRLLIEYSGTTVTGMQFANNTINFLSTANTVSYTPSANYHPATKKYVDDTVSPVSSALSGKQDKATSGSTAPATTPTYVGQQYVNTTNDELYVATGTTSSSDWTKVGSGDGDMLYQDFNWVTKSGASITLDLNSTITASANFTVNAPSTIKDGQIYVLRVITGATAYTMTLGTNVTNPYSEDLTLSANTIAQFSFVGIDNKLELQPSIEVTPYTAGDGIDINNGQISVDVTDIIGTGLTEDASNNITIDTTVVATQTDLSGKQDKATSGSTAPSTTPSYVGQQYVDTTNNILYVAKGTSSSSDWIVAGKTYSAGTGLTLNGTQFAVDTTTIATKSDIANLSSFEVVDTLPSTSTASTKTIYLLGPIGTGADKYEEWIITNPTIEDKVTISSSSTSATISDTITITASDISITRASGFIIAYYIDVYQNGSKLFSYSDGGVPSGLLDANGDPVDSITIPAGTISASDFSTITSISIKVGEHTEKTWTKIGETSIDLSGYALDSNVNTKTFTLSSASDLSTIRDAIAWKNAGKNPIIAYNGYYYETGSYSSGSSWTLYATKVDTSVSGASQNKMVIAYDMGSPVSITISSDAISSGASGDMLYADFNWVTKTGATVTLDINSTITPSANFTVNAPSTIKDGQIYILRVVSGATAYTMTLGTGITNPYSTSTTLTANYTDQFVFQAIGGNLELLPDTDVDISGKQDKATSGSTAPATTPSYVGQQYVDTTNEKLYVATGTTSSSDWMEVGAGGGITIGTTAPSPASAGMLWYDTTSTVKALKCHDGSAWKIVGPEIVPISQSDYDLLSSAEKNNGKFYLITNASGNITASWSDITSKPSDLTAAQIQAGSSLTSGMVSPGVIAASMPVLSTQTGNVASLKIWVGTQTAYNSLSSYDANTLYFTTNVVS